MINVSPASPNNIDKVKQIDDAIRMLMDMTNLSRNKSKMPISYSERFFKDVKYVISEVSKF